MRRIYLHDPKYSKLNFSAHKKILENIRRWLFCEVRSQLIRIPPPKLPFPLNFFTHIPVFIRRGFNITTHSSLLETGSLFSIHLFNNKSVMLTVASSHSYSQTTYAMTYYKLLVRPQQLDETSTGWVSLKVHILPAYHVPFETLLLTSFLSTQLPCYII